ncbi:hypothetical protein BO85DRAFT_283742 [Aspergillus piperis CBS 112811]|uniref:Uncharacterized protein n=1 Tax=Aspergillus piperis CBS 112811 TaxID=1448313 RepID=A0A8G1VMR4_9EURO|nr:hypothetical protein BO85DRAFT_283742 [Aspergillus piperis CBS 112811]RAH57787.1 hypothetical protein BO85DRAFT_283742 [Aspergillus piperis CBS 112811]
MYVCMHSIASFGYIISILWISCVHSLTGWVPLTFIPSDNLKCVISSEFRTCPSLWRSTTHRRYSNDIHREWID